MFWCVLATGVAVTAYWVFFADRTADNRRPSWFITSLVVVSFALTFWSAWLERPSYSYNADVNPIAISIAFDLSPSMLAIPDPPT
jgi:hypothetical protein